MDKIFAILTSFEPPYQHVNWGSTCIEISEKGSVPCPMSVLSDIGIEKVKKGGIVRFFPSDIGYRDLRPLFGEI